MITSETKEARYLVTTVMSGVLRPAQGVTDRRIDTDRRKTDTDQTGV